MAVFKIRDAEGNWIPTSVANHGVQTNWDELNPNEADFINNKPFQSIGENLSVNENGELSAKDTTYAAGQNITIENGVISAKSGDTIKWTDVKEKPFTSIGAGLSVDDQDRLIASDGELIVEDDILKRIGGGGGTQSDWDETDSASMAFIKNKPFEAHIEQVSDLPHVYMDELNITAEENFVDKIDVDDYEWRKIIGVPKSKCFCSSCVVMNHEQIENGYLLFGEQPYPGDEAIIEQFGSVEAFADMLMTEMIEMGHLPQVSKKYIADFNYKPGQLPDLSKLLNGQYQSKVNNILVQEAPISVKVGLKNSDLFSTNSIDVFGNTGLFNNALRQVYKSYYQDEYDYQVNLIENINHITNDDFYFAISELSYLGILSIYLYDIAFSNDIYYQKVPITIPVPNDWEAIPGADEGYQRYQVFGVYDDDQEDLEFTVQVPNRGDYNIKYGFYGYNFWGMTSTPGELRIDTKQYYSTAYPASTSSAVLTPSNGSFYVYTSSNNEYATIKCINKGGYNSESYVYIDLPNDWQIITEKESYGIDTIFTYILNSADKEIVKQIENKYIPKPDWWFGEKEYVISSPEHIFKNVGIFSGGF